MLVYLFRRLFSAGLKKPLREQQAGLGGCISLVCSFGLCCFEQQIDCAGVAYVCKCPAGRQANLTVIVAEGVL